MTIGVFDVDEDGLEYTDPYGDKLDIDDFRGTLAFKTHSEHPVHMASQGAISLINYLQNWLDTGKFEGERKEENDN